MNKSLKIWVTVLLIGSMSVAFGQHRPDRDKIKTLKVAFITERLSLTSSEAQSFWPIYNKYEADRHNLRKEEWQEVWDKLSAMDNISEKEALVLLNKHLALEDEQEKLDKAFLQKLSKIITAKKTLLLMKAEEDFKKQLIKQSHQRQGSE